MKGEYVYHFRCPRDESICLTCGEGVPGYVLADEVACRGGATFVLLEDGRYGIAVCSKKDTFCKRLGTTIARGRAHNGTWNENCFSGRLLHGKVPLGSILTKKAYCLVKMAINESNLGIDVYPMVRRSIFEKGKER